MCLRHAIDAARTAAIEIVLVDLRDLTAVNAAGLALGRAHTAGCHAHGMDLGLLIGHHKPQIVEASSWPDSARRCTPPTSPFCPPPLIAQGCLTTPTACAAGACARHAVPFATAPGPRIDVDVSTVSRTPRSVRAAPPAAGVRRQRRQAGVGQRSGRDRTPIDPDARRAVVLRCPGPRVALRVPRRAVRVRPAPRRMPARL